MINRRQVIGAAATLAVATAATQLATPGTALAAQTGWAACGKCQSLWWPNTPYVIPCPAGGHHTKDGSFVYQVKTQSDGGAGQNDWRSCATCQCLWWSGTTAGRCAGDPNGHRISSYAIGKSWYYLVEFEPQFPSERHQRGWRSCANCSVLFFTPSGSPNGRCAAGGRHDTARSWSYLLRY
jgi:hypothetical protein